MSLEQETTRHHPMKISGLTKKEKGYLRIALKFYVYETTHSSLDDPRDCQTGLPDCEEKEALLNVLRKIEE